MAHNPLENVFNFHVAHRPPDCRLNRNAAFALAYRRVMSSDIIRVAHLFYDFFFRVSHPLPFIIIIRSVRVEESDLLKKFFPIQQGLVDWEDFRSGAFSA